jgi:NAD-dependent oxidoreductase involved in siderophore biosynthesis
MTAQAKTLSIPWGDRTALIPKKMLYVCSLTVGAHARGPYLLLGAFERDEDREEDLRNLFGDAVMTMPDGMRCDLPVGTILRGQGEMGSAEDPRSPKLSLRLSIELGGGNLLLVECLGSVSFVGGPGVLQSAQDRTFAGAAFVATRHETSSPAYRWLNRRQLYGVGRVAGEQRSGERNLIFSFDLYAAG